MATLDLIGSSPKFRTLLDQINMVAPVDCSVLDSGRNGNRKRIDCASHSCG